MSWKYVRIGLFSILLMQCTGVAFGQESPEAQIEFLKRQLQERDKVLLELIERIEGLEERVGVQRAPKDDTESQQADSTEEVSKKPGAVIVDARMTERALERSLSREGALLLRAGTFELEPSSTFFRMEQSASSFVTSNGGTLAGQTERNANRLSLDLAARLGLPWDSQLEIGMPYRIAEVENVTNVGFVPASSSSVQGDGVGDLRVGLAKTLLRENVWRPDLVGRVVWNTDTGKRMDNGVSLGGGFHEVQGSLTAIKRQDPIVFIGGLSYQHSLEKNKLQPGSVYAMNLGAAYALSPETSLRFGLSGAYQSETEFIGNQIDGSSRTLGTFIIGGSTLLAPGVLLNVSLGIGLTGDTDDVSLRFSLPIRFKKSLF